MNIFERLFRNTLQPTERELLEAEAAWWKDSAKHWRDAFDTAADERADLLIDRSALRNALLDISFYTRGQKSGTAQKVHLMCKDALK